MKISRALIEKFGGSLGYQKDWATATEHLGHEVVGHSGSCRERLEGLVKSDAEPKDRLAVSEDCRTRFLADYIEKKDREQSVVPVRGPTRRCRFVRCESGGGEHGVHNQGEGQTYSTCMSGGS